MPELPQVELTDDQIRTIARDYVEHHGEDKDPHLQDIMSHLPKDFMEDGPKVPTIESIKLVASAIRRSVTRVELPIDLYKPGLILDDDECRKYARKIRDLVGQQGDGGIVRKVVARDYDEDLADETIEKIGELVDASEVLILLPGDAEYQPHVDMPKLDDLSPEGMSLDQASGKMTLEEIKEKYPEMYEVLKDQLPEGVDMEDFGNVHEAMIDPSKTDKDFER